jgi:hypothetical protein
MLEDITVSVVVSQSTPPVRGGFAVPLSVCAVIGTEVRIRPRHGPLPAPAPRSMACQETREETRGIST